MACSPGSSMSGSPTGPLFDIIYADEWVVQVVEGRTTRVHLMDPENSRPLPIAIRIGDGSRAQYESGTGLGAGRKVENVTTRAPECPGRPDPPLPATALVRRTPSGRSSTPRDGSCFPTSARATYRLRVIDWLGQTDFDEGILFERDITIPADALPIKVALGGGCVTGRFIGAGDFPERVQVIAVPRGGNGPVRRARCDAEGHFCVRYLDPGDYTLFAHDPKAGLGPGRRCQGRVERDRHRRASPGPRRHDSRYHLLRAAVYPSRTQSSPRGPRESR